MSYQIGDVRIILPIDEERLKETENDYLCECFMLLIKLTYKNQPNIMCLLMEVSNTTYKVFMPEISKLNPLKLLGLTTSLQEINGTKDYVK